MQINRQDAYKLSNTYVDVEGEKNPNQLSYIPTLQTTSTIQRMTLIRILAVYTESSITKKEQAAQKKSYLI